jgi:hypothetical protein
MIGIFDRACELLPPWTKELYSTFSLTSPPHSSPSQTKCTVYTDTDSVCLWGGGVELCCGPYSAGVLRSVSYQICECHRLFTRAGTPPDLSIIYDDRCFDRCFDRCLYKVRILCPRYNAGHVYIQGARGIAAQFIKWSPASTVSQIMTKFSQYTPHSSCYLVLVSFCRQD